MVEINDGDEFLLALNNGNHVRAYYSNGMFISFVDRLPVSINTVFEISKLTYDSK